MRRVNDVSGLCTQREAVREQPRWGGQCQFEDMSVHAEVGQIGRKHGVGYRCAASIAATVLGVVEW